MVVALPFAVGSLVGFFGSVPIAGPVSATVFKRGIERRFRHGFFTALGGAMAKGAYACLALWGFDAFLKPYPLVKPISLAIGAVLLLALGMAFFRHRPRSDGREDSTRVQGNGLSSFALGLSMTLANPTLLVTFTAVAALIHANGLGSMSMQDAIPFGVGTAVGMILWFSFLLAAMKRLHAKLKPNVIRHVVRVMGVLLICLSIWFAWGACTELGLTIV